MCIDTQSKGVLPRDEWITKVDMGAFKADMDALGKKLRDQEGAVDKAHLNMVVNLCDILLVLGVAGLGLSPGFVFPWVFLGMAITFRWGCVMHHVSHGGYVRTNDASLQRGKFAVGGLVNRLRDWLDWILPEAWDVEHNTLHHYNTSEQDDPDVVQRNFQTTRDWDVPQPVKYAMIAFGILTWKWSYYACNTWKHFVLESRRRAGEKIPKKQLERAKGPIMVQHLFGGELEREIIEPLRMFLNVYLPTLFFRIVLPPICFYLLSGWEGCLNSMTNIFLAELWANLHSFFIIVPNHAGDDMYYYETHAKPNTATFYMRQIAASVNYHTGSDPNNSSWYNDTIDLLHGWLNYQIEHHCFPNLSMISYRKAQPELKAIAKKHGIPYIQQSIWTRVWKTTQVMVGNETMRLFPRHLDRPGDVSDTQMHKFD
eukprot:TRINITY_DN73531_c0_g1_i1.p1 TRINITY_DN73531_c0_g1~~TRINITY_DN73531_c0_g1_i1.p1  ORF type:complete len:427 (+),score=172.35 TRINITY_DN73531_c0_g1_i1:71-1351(+)